MLPLILLRCGTPTSFFTAWSILRRIWMGASEGGLNMNYALFLLSETDYHYLGKGHQLKSEWPTVAEFGTFAVTTFTRHFQVLNQRPKARTWSEYFTTLLPCRVSKDLQNWFCKIIKKGFKIRFLWHFDLIIQLLAVTVIA